MIRILGAAALVAATLTAVPAVANDYRAQSHSYRERDYQGGTPYNNDPGSNPAFTQGCPPGAIPESFPNQTGRRCALRGGGYTY